MGRAGTRHGDCVAQYLYIHSPGEQFEYPSSRSSGGTATTAMRYLECALVQAASLRLHGVDCDLVLVMNVEDPHDPELVSPRGLKLLEKMESLGTRLLFAPYAHRSAQPVGTFEASRYVLDAIRSVTAESDPGQRVWFTDTDCVWINPERVFAAAPPEGSVGAVHFQYPAEGDINGISPNGLGELGRSMGHECPVPVRWVGGELLCGRSSDLAELVTACEGLDRELAAHGTELPLEEHLLSLAGGVGFVDFTDQGSIAWRIWTGPRHGAPPHSDPATLGLWHLPSEKGLGFRRAADAVLSDDTDGLMHDLEDPRRAMRRFNVRGGGWTRRLRDDSWLTGYRLRRAIKSRIGRSAG